MHAAQSKMACKGILGMDELNSSSHQGSHGLVGGARGGDVLCGIVADGLIKSVQGTKRRFVVNAEGKRVKASQKGNAKGKNEKPPKTTCDIPSYTTEVEPSKRVRSVAASWSAWET
jgi:hypothetical protein